MVVVVVMVTRAPAQNRGPAVLYAYIKNHRRVIRKWIVLLIVIVRGSIFRIQRRSKVRKGSGGGGGGVQGDQLRQKFAFVAATARLASLDPREWA